MFSKEDIRSVIYGVAVADALGAPFEFSPSEDIQGPIEMIGGDNPLGAVRPGQWTDDTEMTLLLAEAAGEGMPLNWQGLAKKYISWAESEPRDIGNTTRAALQGADGFDDATAKAETFHRETGRSAGNGTIMRAAPLAFLPIEDEQLAEVVLLETRITHRAQEAFEASLLQAIAIRRLLKGEDLDLEEMTFTAGPRPLSTKTAEAISKHMDQEYLASAVAEGGTAWSSLAAALWALSLSSFEEGVWEVIKLGYDTDTNAACAGALLAAKHGFDAIPERWVEKIDDRPRIDSAIKGLCQVQGDL